MKKYKIIYGLILFAAATLFSACNDMLNEKNYDFISNVEDSDAGADQLALGAYSYMLNDMFRWDEFYKILDIDCDYSTGPDWALSEIGAGNFQGASNMDPLWTKGFIFVGRTNFAMEEIEKLQNASSEAKNNCIAEMKLLKALAYFWLVRAYGELPIMEHSAVVDNDLNKPRKPITEVYAYIIALLEDAEKNLYKNTDSKWQEGRASAGAAASLLAKVYLTMASGAVESGNIDVKGGIPFTGSGDSKKFTDPVVMRFAKNKVEGYNFDAHEYFVKAREKAKQVMDGEYGSYDLLSYDNLWTAASRNKTEHIFAIQPLQGSDVYGLGISRWYTGTTDGTEMIIEGLFFGMRDHWYKLFEKNDLRVVKGVMHRWINRDYHQSWNGGAFYPNNDEWSIKARGYFVNGQGDTIYNDPATGLPYELDPMFNDGRSYTNDNSSQYIAWQMKYFNATDRSNVRTDVPWPVLRFADVLLIYAEASNEANGAPTQDALNALNRVRIRSAASAKTLTGAGAINTLESFRSVVLEERAREFACEGDRRWDLIRWGIYLQAMNGITGPDEIGINKVRQTKHLLFPIPADEMSSNTAITKNNPDW
ncbi:membrane protein [Bacteroidia bacterium]|nr:membrane protein [Bacteroidia bacterium]